MKRFSNCLILFLAGLFLFVSLTSCGEKEKQQSEMAVGNWTHLRNRAYVLLVTSPAGGWQSSVKITDVTSKIVKSKGSANGTWHIENNQMIFTVSESDIEDIWEKNATLFFDIVLLNESQMHLKDESGYITMWKQATRKATAQAESNLNPIVPMGPIAVNINKNRSNDKDRYLCLNLNLVIKELMPEEGVPPIHPRARDAAMIFLSSLVFNDVKDFDSIKAQNKKLSKIMNPYMEGVIKEVEIEHVVVAAEIEKVEEFMIEHTLVEDPSSEDGEEGEDGEKKDKS